MLKFAHGLIQMRLLSESMESNYLCEGDEREVQGIERRRVPSKRQDCHHLDPELSVRCQGIDPILHWRPGVTLFLLSQV